MLATVKTHRQMFPNEQCVPWLVACEQQKYELFKTIHILWSSFSKLVSVPTKSSFLAEHKVSAAVYTTTLLLGWFCISLIDFFFLNPPEFALEIHKEVTCGKGFFICTRYGTSLHLCGVINSVWQASCLGSWVKSYLSRSQAHLSGGKDAFLSPYFLSRVSLTFRGLHIFRYH